MYKTELLLVVLGLGVATPASAQHEHDLGSEEDRALREPALPEGMTLDEVLERAAQPPPSDFPDAIHDDGILWFFQGDQLEYRADDGSDPNVLGWEANAWVGGDFYRLVFKPEGEASFREGGSLEAESDVVLSRLVSPFWSIQAGAQYAQSWASGEAYRDRVSAALALQGLAPGMFEVDLSIYLSEDGDLSSTLELEYDWRFTQRLVAQARTELGLAAQNVPEWHVGAGLSTLVAGLRLRYELERELAPYLGIRWEGRLFEAGDLARDDGEAVWRFFGVAGVRFALL